MGTKSKWSAWYNLAGWQHRRNYQLQVEPLCRMCKQDGKIEPATCVDHITPHRGNYNLFVLGELQSLCGVHHNKTKKFIEQHGFDPAVGVDGLPIDPRHPIYRYDKH
jgi:hypothetical protein